MIYGVTALAVYAVWSMLMIYRLERVISTLIAATMTQEERLNALDGGDRARNAAILRAHQHMRDRS